jgi:hypothetical protein
MTETKRKGTRSIKDIPKDILEQLNRGEIETANLVEWLAIDGRVLLETLGNSDLFPCEDGRGKP